MSATLDSLPSELQKITKQFAGVPDPKLRYQQLLSYASKLPVMDEDLKQEQCRVKGCQSTVFVHATRDDAGKIFYSGDSDSQLTKVRCPPSTVRGLNTFLTHSIFDIYSNRPTF